MKTITLQEPSQADYKVQKTLQSCLAVFTDELQLAVQWRRPSILFAVHNARTGLDKAKAALQRKISALGLSTVTIHPGMLQNNILPGLAVRPDASQVVFFVERLGGLSEVYAGLNLHRERVVEHQIKIVFWLLNTEMAVLAHHAPDFWSFRHRVIQLPVRLGATQFRLPAGALLWSPVDEGFGGEQNLDDEIRVYERGFDDVSPTREETVLRLDLLCNLARLYWLKGDHNASEARLLEALKQVDRRVMRMESALLLNGLSILSYARGQRKHALQLSTEAMNLSPNQAYLKANAGALALASGKGRSGMALLQRALAMQPDGAGLWALKGLACFVAGNFEEALPAFEKAVALAPENIRHVVGNGLCHVRLGNHHLADSVLGAIPASAYEREPLLEVMRMQRLTGADAGLQVLQTRIADPASCARLQYDPLLSLLFQPAILAKAFARCSSLSEVPTLPGARP